ncbi:MAG: Foldase protein PrsA [Myxococcota bacterium]|nr:Foldase protein PrsA [Myxococcota bacterium]
MFKINRIVLSVLALAAPLCLGCDKKPAEEPSKPAKTDTPMSEPATSTGAAAPANEAGPVALPSNAVARIGGQIITEDDLKNEFERYPPEISATPDGRKNILRHLVEQSLIVHEATEKGFDKRPDIKAKLDEYRRRVLQEELMKEVYSKVPEVSDADMKKYYDDHLSQFNLPARVHLSHIQFDATEKDLANKVMAELRKSPDKWAELCKQHSRDTFTKDRGGDLGPLAADQRPYVSREGFKLQKKGQMAGPIQSSLGFHIIRLENRYQPESKSFDEAKKTLKVQMQGHERIKLYTELMKNLKERLKPEVMEARVEAMQGRKPPTPAASPTP